MNHWTDEEIVDRFILFRKDMILNDQIIPLHSLSQHSKTSSLEFPQNQPMMKRQNKLSNPLPKENITPIIILHYDDRR